MTATPVASPSRPPEQIDAGPVLLRRQTPADAEALTRAVLESLEHLKPWMPWASPEAATLVGQVRRLREVDERWAAGTEFVYSLCAAQRGAPVVGVIGLHRRIGPGGIEIGYWTHAAYAGLGYMTAAVAALTPAALALPQVDRVEIHTDEANERSAAIPRKLGYRLDRVDTRPPEAPAETGRLQIWITP